MNIDISEINKNTLKLMEILCKSVKITLIMTSSIASTSTIHPINFNNCNQFISIISI